MHNPRKYRKGGGVGLYLVDNFDLVFSCTEFTESLSLFVEINIILT